MKRLAIALIALAVVGGAAVLFVECGTPPPAPPKTPVVAAPVLSPDGPAPQVTVQHLVGKVEARRAGQWAAVHTGDHLGLKDAIRTGDSGRATLAVGDQATVAVRPRSEVSVRDVSATVARIRLERGRVGANLKGGLHLKIESKGSTTVAEASHGRFSVFNSGTGLVAVASQTAQVHLSAKGGDATLAAGQAATVQGDAAPKTSEIPKQVFLNVVWPDHETRAKTVMVHGSVKTGTDVMLNGQPVAVGPGGTFTARVPVDEGRNRIRLEAIDLSGRAKQADRMVLVHRKGPKVKANSQNLWK